MSSVRNEASFTLLIRYCSNIHPTNYKRSLCSDNWYLGKVVKVKAHTSQGPTRPELIPVSVAWTMPRSMLLPPGRDSSPSNPSIHLGEERQSGVSSLSKERTRRARLEPRTSRSRVTGVNRSATHAYLRKTGSFYQPYKRVVKNSQNNATQSNSRNQENTDPSH